MAKLLRILAALDRISSPAGIDIPGFRLHPLKDRMQGHYAVSVSSNWRVTFRFDDGHAVDVDYREPSGRFVALHVKLPFSHPLTFAEK